MNDARSANDYEWRRRRITMNDARRANDHGMTGGFPRLQCDFFLRDVLEVAPELLGKSLVRRYDDGTVKRFAITETEAYRGDGDLACHASRGKTTRNEVMFREGGLVYIYFIYGMYWMLNFVTGPKGDASAVLIRGLEGINGPGRVGKILQLDRTFYGENLSDSQRIWIEDSLGVQGFTTHPRVGIHYAGEPWISMPWRFVLDRSRTKGLRDGGTERLRDKGTFKTGSDPRKQFRQRHWHL